MKCIMGNDCRGKNLSVSYLHVVMRLLEDAKVPSCIVTDS